MVWTTLFSLHRKDKVFYSSTLIWPFHLPKRISPVFTTLFPLNGNDIMLTNSTLIWPFHFPKKFSPIFTTLFPLHGKDKILTNSTLIWPFHFSKKSPPYLPRFFHYMLLKPNWLFLTLLTKKKFKFDFDISRSTIKTLFSLVALLFLPNLDFWTPSSFSTLDSRIKSQTWAVLKSAQNFEEDEVVFVLSNWSLDQFWTAFSEKIQFRPT